MHLQLYLTPNHIISHIVDSFSGLIFIAVSLVLFKEFELYAFPIAMIISYLSCHWVSARFSLRSINQSLWSFEKHNVIMIIIALLLHILFI